MVTGIRKLVIGASALVSMAAAQLSLVGAVLTAERLNNPAPLAGAPRDISAGQIAATFAAAQRAQDLGMPTLAISAYQELLGAPGVDRGAVSLLLATALLDAGRAAEAEQVLQAAPGARGPEWRLRLGLAAAQQKKWDLAREQVSSTNVDELQRPDRAWFWFLQAVIADNAVPRDEARANEHYKFAEREAPNEMALATFLAAGQRARLSLGYTPAEMEAERQRFQRLEQMGSQQAYRHAALYAAMRAAAGQKGEAVQFLSSLLVRIPRAERETTDDLLRLLGLIGDRTRGGAGRNALNQLLEAGSNPEYQRQALQILAQQSVAEPERSLFRAQLDRLLAGDPKSAIRDAVLLMRAELALGDTPRNYAVAEARATELKDHFPGSALRPHAFVVLASSAWEQSRFRLAADNARQAREALAATPAAKAPTEAKVIAQMIAELRVMEAEAYFRAQDYRQAADAYGAAMRQPPVGIAPGDLMFQRALSAIKADQTDPNANLERIVDELAADPRFDPTNRWEAEWSLSRGLKVQGKTQAALERVSRLLTAGEQQASAVPASLRARMAWLQVKLSFDANRPELTLELAPRLETAVTEVSPEMRAEIISSAALLKAQAEFKLEREAAALATLDKLRADFPKSDAAVESFLITADYYSAPGRDKIQEAQNVLRKLIDDPNYKRSAQVPFALYRLAMLSKGLRQPKDLQEANDRIEELVKPDRDPPPPADLVFLARLEQGDLLREMNEFSRAQVAYEALVNNPRYAQFPDVQVAQLKLASLHNAQSSTDPSGSHADQAQSLFEELLYRVTAPEDVRVEAGYNLGKLLERRGQLEKARDVWWRDVIKPFLVDAKPDAPASAQKPYWLARTLRDLGELFAQQKKIDEARRIYVMLRDSGLGHGRQIAIERLEQLGVPPPQS